MRTIWFLLLSAVCMADLPSATAGEPSAADLVKMAPVIDSSDPKVKSIEIGGTMKLEGLHVRFRAVYRAPDHYALLLSDGSDGTPLIFAADRQMLIYDPVRPSVLCMKNSHFSLAVRGKGESLSFRYEFGKSSDNKDEIVFDGKSLFARTATVEKVVKEGDHAYRLFRTNPEGTTFVSSIDQSRKQPIECLKVFNKTSHEANLTIDRIAVDEPLGDEEFRFPDKIRLAENIDVHDWPGDGLLEILGEMAMISRAYQARLGANHPGLRRSIRFPGFRRIDWDEVRENDRKISVVLKEFLPTSRFHPQETLDLPPIPPASGSVRGEPVAGATSLPVR